MGGSNSGRHSPRATVEATGSLKLDVHRWMEGFDPARTVHKQCILGGSFSGDITAIIEPVAADAAQVTLTFNIGHLTTETGPQRQEIAVVATPAPFGGQRWWWMCPAGRGRVVKLYLPNGGRLFYSRQAYRLEYACQRGTAIDRVWAKERRLFRKLKADPGGASSQPDKPRGMHWRTYAGICDQLDDIEDARDRHFEAGAARILARVR